MNEELVAIEAGSDLDVDSVLLLEKRFARFLDQKLQRHDLAVGMMRRMLAQETGDPSRSNRLSTGSCKPGLGT